MGMSTARSTEYSATQPGQQVASARRARGQNQADLAKLLQDYMRTKWTRQMVSDLENGAKTFTVEILRAVANVQRFPYVWYMDGVDGTLRGNTLTPAGADIPRYLKPKNADVIDIHTRERLAN